MSDHKEVIQMDEQKPVPSSPGLATKMRPKRPKAEDPLEQKLKEVKEHKPHFDEMTSYMRTLLKPVDGTTMTKRTVPVQQTSPGKPASPGKASSPGRGSSPAKPTSPAKHSSPAKPTSPAKHSSPAGPSSATRRSSLVGRYSPPRRSMSPGHSSPAGPSSAGHSSPARPSFSSGHFSPPRPSFAARHSSPPGPSSAARHSSTAGHSSPPGPSSAARRSSPPGTSSAASHSPAGPSSAGCSSTARPSTSSGHAPPPRPSFAAGPSSSAGHSSPAGPSFAAGRCSSGEQDSTLKPSTSGYANAELNCECRPAPSAQIPGSSTAHPIEERIRLPGSPIPPDEIAQEEFVPAIITPPQPPMELVQIDSDLEVVNTWECAPVDTTSEEVMVVGNDLTMFIRNPDGTYDLYTGLQPAEAEVENPNFREITFSDGPLVILTRDDDGKLTYDPDDTVVIDIADNSLYVLNIEESSDT